MTAEEVRQLSPDELRVKEREVREQLFRLRLQLAAGQMESIRRIRTLRKDLARLLTVKRQRVMGVEHARS
ncbi:MAG: 50S ribosomal protein L29 [Acidobacteria bacterium]|nr:50S ribosomal protein L29 [Acidobacteriota bacterium]